MRSAKRVAVDTEADSLHHYFEKVCLIQVGINGYNAVIDPLADLNLEPFLHVLSTKRLIFHGGDYDLRMLRQSLGFRPKSEVFDTVLAAQVLGYERYSLSALAEQLLDVTLSKKGQKSNWARRPLTEPQLRYAADDTRYIERIANLLEQQLAKLDRVTWHREMCKRMVEATARDNDRDRSQAWRIKGLGRMEPRELAFVRSLWHWRDREARKVDRPAFKIMGNPLLIDLAVWAITHPDAPLTRGPKLPRDCRGQRLNALQKAIAEAHSLQPSQWPQPRKRHPTQEDPSGFRPRQTAMIAECAKLASDLGIEPAILAPRAALGAIARHRPTTIKDIMACGPLLHWQAKLLQPAIEKTLKDHPD